jgi:hypothetical protein
MERRLAAQGRHHRRHEAREGCGGPEGQQRYDDTLQEPEDEEREQNAGAVQTEARMGQRVQIVVEGAGDIHALPASRTTRNLAFAREPSTMRAGRASTSESVSTRWRTRHLAGVA